MSNVYSSINSSLHRDKLVLQLHNFSIILKAGILVSIVSFIGELYRYYRAGWSSSELITYGLAFGVYVTILSGYLYLIQKEKKQFDEKRSNYIRFLFYSVTFLITSAMFIVMFMGRIYGNELYFLSSINFIFGVLALYDEKERIAYLSLCWIYYIIGSLIIIPDSPSLLSNIGQAFALNVLTYITGRATMNWFLQLKVSNIKLQNSVSSQLETLNYLAANMDTYIDENYTSRNLGNINEAVKSLLIEFSQSKENLAQALSIGEEAAQAKEAFFANMSHEIRTPLNAILGMIRELNDEDLTPTQRSYLKNIDVAANHLLSIVNNVLDISKLESDTIKLNLEDLSLENLIKDMVSMMKIKAREKGLDLNLNIDPALEPALKGDMSRLRQIFFNIIGNAIKFTENGQVDVRVNVREDFPDKQCVEIQISDTGIGMEQEFLGRIFDKFSQEEKGKYQTNHGSGLGMSITNELVKLMGGRLEIETQKNKGTTVSFYLRFPKGDIRKVVKGGNPKILDQALKGKKVLLVDDDKINRLVAHKSLNKFGADVEEATNGKEAIEWMERDNFDLILMDVQMPVMDGLKATRYIRETMHSDIPIIALTANAFKSDLESYIENGMNNFVTKPYDESSLLHKMLEVLEN